MRKFILILTAALLVNFSVFNAAFAAITENDYREVIKITKKLRKMSDKNDIKGLSKYYSENYKSFDGYDKEHIMEIFETAGKLYPDSKTKEKIIKIEDENDLIKVYIDETSSTKILIEGEEASYASEKKIKGKMTSSANYSMTYKKEEAGWRVIADEIYEEITDIRYGEAIKSAFQMETPDKLTPGEEFSVKTTLEVPKERYVVGSIGHDKIIYPPEKYWDPYRAIDSEGILERVMIANKEGLNEYANATFAFVKAFGENEENALRATISGMGFYVKRINMQKDEK